MSRSLRTRPMTLYSKEDQPSIPPVSSASHARPGHLPNESISLGSKVLKKSRKKASGVGFNLKKRLSMRYAEPTELGPGGFSAVPQAPSLPPMPQIQIGDKVTPPYDGRTMPIMGDSFAEDFEAEEEGYRGRPSVESVRSGTDNFAGDPAIDLHLLSQQVFDPQAYLRAKLSQHSESSLRTFKQSLACAKEAANEDLKKQVFKNYSQFITISKEIATLENDMLELKELLADWKQLPQALEFEDATGPSAFSDSFVRGKGGHGNRTSMVDLQQIYRAQITSLWEGIEGSQKFLPFVPGRHLIAEASTFTELNSATYKPKQGVALFLLDDLLLIAVRKKRQMSSKVRLVAERCFSLAEIVVIDLKDGGDLTNAIKVKRGKETYVYRTDRAEDKKALLNAFRRVAEELENKRRKESNAEAEARKRESTLLSSPTQLGGLGATRAGNSSSTELLASIDEDGVSSDSVLATAAASAASERKDPGRWNNDFADELAVCIALRQWEEAVTLVEKGKGILTTYSPSELAYVDLSEKLASRINDLVAAISADFGQQNIKKSAVVRNAGYLLRLDKGEKARELFLNARSELLKRRTRQIKFEGEVSLYISELALVHFTLIKNTSEWYMSAFKDNRMASGFVQWASTQVEAYAEMFRRQVYGVDQDHKVVSEALQISRSSAAQLKAVGLDFSYLIDELLRPEGVIRPIPALTLTTAEEPNHSAPIHASAQEIRRQSMLQLS